MRIVYKNTTSFAVLEKDHYTLLEGPGTAGALPNSLKIPLQDAQLLAPILPSKIIAIGLNYGNHAKELEMEVPETPVLFMKPLSALADPGAAIQLPGCSRQVDFEGELAIVIGVKGHCIPQEKALEYVMGYTLANDITARDLQKKDGQWTRAKGFDGFCPVGPCIRTGIDPALLEFKTFLNDELRQTGKVSDFIFSIPEIIAFVSEVMTLLPGDVILTGTPPGIGPMQPGDRVRIECDAIGTLENTMTAF